MLPIIGLVLAFCAVGYAQPPIWSATGCGISKYLDAGNMPLPFRIVGGEATRPYEFPWQASLRRNSTDRHFCGGVILNERWILSAAHCADGETPAILSIVVGEWDTTDDNSLVRQTLPVETIIMHPLYNPRTLENDVSLIKVAKDITLSPDVAPVCAPDPANLYEYWKSECSGWGTLASGDPNLPAILQYVTMNITTNKYCTDVYAPQNEPVFDDMICATDNTGSFDRDSCQGDSGGPLTIKEADGTFRVVGTVSWGIGCASGYPGVYARVGYFADWITTTIGAN